MLENLIGLRPETVTLAGAVFAFLCTFVCIVLFRDKLPRDQGRAFAVEGNKSVGKCRGAGLIFVLVFFICDLTFNTYSKERLLYDLIIVLCMFTGFFDDASSKPWNEYLKGALDLLLGIGVAITFLHYNPNVITLSLLGGREIVIPPVLFGIGIVVLVWVAINATNCTDGVDGLSATLTSITLISFAFAGSAYMQTEYLHSGKSILFFILTLLAYLWFNANPSTVLMGDAGSRAMGMMIAIMALMSGDPLLYIPFSLMMILDGFIGLIKVSLKRFLHISIFRNTRFPLHDHFRHVKKWDKNQVVFRFVIVQIMISLVVLLYRGSIPVK
ncbi:MAG: phospho-N-acetylmuramoyl-pentapeptide-transferase [Lachnospiraceae bacterium]|nr:phospho-N-acetylmuramoyl-pentapeptide-transferase [Lachnospiraceae bacterium]